MNNGIDIPDILPPPKNGDVKKWYNSLSVKDQDAHRRWVALE